MLSNRRKFLKYIFGGSAGYMAGSTAGWGLGSGLSHSYFSTKNDDNLSDREWMKVAGVGFTTSKILGLSAAYVVNKWQRGKYNTPREAIEEGAVISVSPESQ